MYQGINNIEATSIKNAAPGRGRRWAKAKRPLWPDDALEIVAHGADKEVKAVAA